ncbi:uncharacterized protein C2845_PM07G31520 [Panicum miliaceum]|uniref:Reverse transcriptase domain-containing protein n=1 Tax=Panicum miliaceum TaxID=4540 RepID=A0A3L6SUI8_PANMI|nr:uncharacterized protein C2845_PM07G31520 [Panicum miliaceum]
MVPQLEWLCQGNTLTVDMRVLDLGAYDAILGYDWLKNNSPMQCDWEQRTVEFVLKGKRVKLQGLQPTPVRLDSMTAKQLWKSCKGNDIWAYAIVNFIPEQQLKDIPETIQCLLQQYTDIFSDPKVLPPTRVYDHAIPLQPDAVPINCRPYKYSPQHKTEIERQVKELLEAELITHSTSPFASPVLLVQKKDGSWRFCVDYRRLNAITIKNRFPMPIIEEILDELAGSKYFTKLDMKSGYHQVRMLLEDEYKTAFKTHQGHYQFKVMPFGLTNAPSTFQCIMNEVLKPFLRKFVLVFLDDILIFSPSLQAHEEHVQQVFEVLRNHKFFLKPSKCSFAQHSLEYLGHIISRDGVATDPAKTKAMLQWPRPASITEVRGFLGLTGYYRKFVRNYGVLAKPLTQLLQKRQFQWTDQAEHAFLTLKSAMMTTPVLALPDFKEPFVIETDACDGGIGAVLMQKEQPVFFLSKALGEKHKQLSIYEEEFLALLMAVEKWRQYLQEHEFIIRTDHKSLAYLNEQNLHSDMQRKAMASLMGLKFKILYKKGKENVAADALSRVAHLMTLQVVSEVQPVWVQEVLNSYSTDSQAQTLIAQLAVHSPNAAGYSLDKGLIRYNGKLWIGNNSALQTKIISAFHSSAISGHSGTYATYQRVKKNFYWKGSSNISSPL